MKTEAIATQKDSSGINQQITGSEILLRSLIAEEVQTLFGYPGGAIMPVYDSLYSFSDQLKHILVRHEQGAIHAAQGFARVSGKTGVVLATSGPGATNLITGLADAMIDSTPLVCITGQVASHLLGTDAFQETDIINISLPVTKWNIQVTRAADVASAVARAFFIAKSGRPGPVLIDITKDAQFEMADFHYEICHQLKTYKPIPNPDQRSIAEAAKLINEASRPYILSGQGIILSGAQTELIDCAEKAGIPVASTLLGLSGFPASHPLYVGYLGMHGNYSPNVNTNECDVLIAIGMRFDDRVTGNVAKYAPNAKVIHIDIDESEIGKIIKTEVGIHADAKHALTLLLPHLKKTEHPEWLASFKKLDELEKAIIQQDCHPECEGLKMGEVVRRLNQITQGNSVVCTDVGQHQMVTSRYYSFNDLRSCISSGGLGTMGFCLPAAMGAKCGAPEKDVIAIIGDGGFQMTIQELGTIMQYQIPVKIIILNNNFLGMVRQWQQLFFDKRYSFTEMDNPDFVAIAKAYRIESQKVESRDYLDQALMDMMNHKGPYLLEVVVEKEENVFPMVPTGAGVAEMRLT
ncbi:biosynthetic-type acetolactate synthase large subunit [Daejeonella oryzae]|uniref:biosynthetic-type acetolactate synthase large subunit n=1 Tax=Daejeonella oryzae TaxID=1122943 RepID=UPI0004165287|nr:biosynthetic-type acetolactate synthase large subunit [Daejeonella oryzae]